jgi:hypothetical protein
MSVIFMKASQSFDLWIEPIRYPFRIDHVRPGGAGVEVGFQIGQRDVPVQAAAAGHGEPGMRTGALAQLMHHAPDLLRRPEGQRAGRDAADEEATGRAEMLDDRVQGRGRRLEQQPVHPGLDQGAEECRHIAVGHEDHLLAQPLRLAPNLAIVREDGLVVPARAEDGAGGRRQVIMHEDKW